MRGRANERGGINVGMVQMHAAALQFARTEGIIPAPEPTHAIAATIREALACKESGEAKVIVTALCGHGHFDLASYDKFLAGEMVDLDYPADKVRDSMSKLPNSSLN